VETSVLKMFSGLRNMTKTAKNKCKLPQLQRKGNKNNDLTEKSVLRYLLFSWVCWKSCSPVAKTYASHLEDFGFKSRQVKDSHNQLLLYTYI